MKHEHRENNAIKMDLQETAGDIIKWAPWLWLMKRAAKFGFLKERGNSSAGYTYK
jgi:hypothetical protein